MYIKVIALSHKIVEIVPCKITDKQRIVLMLALIAYCGPTTVL